MILETERLLLRPCEERDRDLFYDVSSDPRVLEFFPFRRSRNEADAVFDMVLAAPVRDGLDFFVLALKESDEGIGFSGLSKPDLAPILPPETVEIGWRLSARHWRQGYATEAANRLLRHGFETLGLPEIVSLSVQGNDRSEAVMRRIGMRRDEAGDFDHPHIPAGQSRLSRHLIYRLDRARWRAAHG